MEPMDLEQKDWWQWRALPKIHHREPFPILIIYNFPRQLHSPYPTSLLVFGHTCTRVVLRAAVNFVPLLASLCRQLLRYPCVHFTHFFGTRDRSTNARDGSRVGMNEKCQASSLHVHPLSVHRSGSSKRMQDRWCRKILKC